MDAVIRRAGAADAELLSLLNADVQAFHADALPWRFKQPVPGSFSATAAELIGRPGTIVLIAEIEGQPAGYAYAEVFHNAETPARFIYHAVHLHHIGVRPQYRRRGVGAALIEAVRSAGEELGVTLMTLDVWSFNEQARAFFRRHGFAPYIERLWNRPAD